MVAGKMLMIRGRGVLMVVIALICVAASPATAQHSWGPDGRPRPYGLADAPTESYGPIPTCLDNGVAVNCEWYGFANTSYPAESPDCLLITRAILANTTLYPPGKLQPYAYYSLKYYTFDPVTNDSYCYYGCFDMSASPPPIASPPSGGTLGPPPVQIPPPPPPSVLVPPPIDAPPPSPPPPSFVPTPASATTPSPSDATPLAPPITTSPPPPGSTPRVVNLNGARFLHPMGTLVSFMISGALLLLNGLLA